MDFDFEEYKAAGFDPFEPGKNTLRSPFLRNLVSRAILLLKGRSLEDLSAAAFNIYWMLQHYSRVEFPAGSFVMRASMHSRDLVSDLKKRISDFRIEDDESFRNGFEYEYFAVLALVCAGEVAVLEREYLGPYKEIMLTDSADWSSKTRESLELGYFEQAELLITDYAIQAADAVSCAEFLSKVDWKASKLDRLSLTVEELAAERSKQALSSRARAGAIARHKENHQFKEDVGRWYHDNKHKYFGSTATDTLRRLRKAAVEANLVNAAARSIKEWVSDAYHADRQAMATIQR
jgi:hypothetical protein